MPATPPGRRCTARTRVGTRCRNWAARPDPHAPASDPPLCAIHALRRPLATGNTRCTATTTAGAPCRQYAQPGSDPPRCHTHGPGITPGRGDHHRRCTARTRAGTRCRNWATAGSQGGDRPLCRHHQGGRPLPQGDHPHRCTAPTVTGRRCRKWAARGTDPPLCAVHDGRAGNHPATPADRAAGRVCTATTIAGRPCKKWALRHTDPPRCWIHAYPDLNPAIHHGYFRRTPFLPEPARAHLRHLAAAGPPLAPEIALLRLKIRALLAYLRRPDLSTARRLAAHRLLLRALPTVARLLRTRHALAPTAHPPAPGTALSPTAAGWLNTALRRLLDQPEDLHHDR